MCHFGSVYRRFLYVGSPFCRRSVVMILSCYLSFVDSCARVPVDSSCARVPVDSSCARVPVCPWIPRVPVCPWIPRVPVCPWIPRVPVCPWIPRAPVCPCARRPVRRPISANVHFVRKGCGGPSKIAILAQFLTSNVHFVRKSCVSWRSGGTAPALRER